MFLLDAAVSFSKVLVEQTSNNKLDYAWAASFVIPTEKLRLENEECKEISLIYPNPREDEAREWSLRLAWGTQPDCLPLHKEVK